MIARLRSRHRTAWILAAVALAVILALALALRPEQTLDSSGLEQLGPRGGRSPAGEP